MSSLYSKIDNFTETGTSLDVLPNTINCGQVQQLLVTDISNFVGDYRIVSYPVLRDDCFNLLSKDCSCEVTMYYRQTHTYCHICITMNCLQSTQGKINRLSLRALRLMTSNCSYT